MCSVCEKKGIHSLSSPGTPGVCRSRGPADKTHLSLGNATAWGHLLPLMPCTPGSCPELCRPLQNKSIPLDGVFPPSLNFHGYKGKSGHSRLLPVPNSKTRKSTQLSVLPALPPVAGQMGTNEGFLLGINRFPQGKQRGSQFHHSPTFRQQDEMSSLSPPKTD